MIQKIKRQLFFKSFGSCVYLIKLNEKNILVDTSSSANKDELIKNLKELNLSPLNINIILLTHHHWDHVENLDLFSKAKIYGDKTDFKNKKILDLDKLKISEFKIIKTPGHTKGSVCFLYENILFSGDTIFHDGIGRMDLPGGSETEMQNSLKKLNYKILCPGHI
ncbi:MBL fold metallo-hydrolase [Candidatus Pacearchaeota archaeon]|nr:MBL fold metallo-hydrolase [Candidatus Pacearchaeota archaeon]